MRLEDYNDIVIIVGFALFLILAVSTLIKFRKMNIEFIRARIFLKKDFIIKNFLNIIIAGSLLAFHEFIHISAQRKFISNSYNMLAESLEAISLLFLVLWVYSWRKLMQEK